MSCNVFLRYNTLIKFILDFYSHSDTPNSTPNINVDVSLINVFINRT